MLDGLVIILVIIGIPIVFYGSIALFNIGTKPLRDTGFFSFIGDSILVVVFGIIPSGGLILIGVNLDNTMGGILLGIGIIWGIVAMLLFFSD